MSTESKTTNAAAFERAQRVIPGGVNSPVRAFRAVGGTPRFISRAQGAYLWDVEGKRYIDYIGSWGPMILGHGHPAVLDAVVKAAYSGLSFGAPTEAEAELAEAIIALAKIQKLSKNRPALRCCAQAQTQIQRRAGIRRQLTTIHRVSPMRREHQIVVKDWNRIRHLILPEL